MILGKFHGQAPIAKTNHLQINKSSFLSLVKCALPGVPSRNHHHTYKTASWKGQRAQKRHDPTIAFLWHCINFPSLSLSCWRPEPLALLRHFHLGHFRAPNRILTLGFCAFGNRAETKHVRGESSARSLPEQPQQKEWRRSRGSFAYTHALPHNTDTPTTPEFPFPAL